MKYLLYILLIIPVVAFAQSFNNTGIPMAVTEGAILKVNENFINSGNLLNAGQLVVGGNWVNTGVYQTSGAGVIDMNGSLDQLINDQTYIQNLRLSGADKTLNADLAVDQLELNGSKLTVADGFSLEINPSGSIIRQPDDYVIGRLIMTGDQTFPIGTPNYFMPVSIDHLSSEETSIGIKAVESPLSGPLANTVAEIAPIHWVMDESEALFNVELRVEGADFLQSIENAIVVEANGLNGAIRSLYQDSVSGSTNLGSVTNDLLHPLSLPYFTYGRKYIASEKPPIKVLNLISPNDDGKNDFLFIQNIDAYPECQVVIYDRWGTKVFEQEGYDNQEKVFRGKNNVFDKNDLTEGTFYYVIKSGADKLSSGFFELMR